MKQLKEGFTTGSCAAAGALASCLWQRDGECPERVELKVPEGRIYTPVILPHNDHACGIIKDPGDDPDITKGLEIITRVELLPGNGDITFAAGEGVGIITQPGLKCPVGEPAINPVPRAMITEAIRSVFGPRAAKVTVSIPGGREIARKTFNPRLGIRDGLSVLGTSGVVRPMSEEALKDSMLVELKMLAAQGYKELLITFGNQGEEALSPLYPDLKVFQASNYIGFALDSALELGFEHLVIGGHPGKMCKLSAGIMQTHSKYADGRREAIVTQLALMQAPQELMRRVYASITAEAAIGLIDEYDLLAVWDRLAGAAHRYVSARVRGEMKIDIIFADSAGRILGKFEEGRL